MEQRIAGLGQRVFAARKAAGFSRKRLSGLLGIDQSVLGRIERDELTVTAERLVLLARLLGTTTSYLLGETEEAKAS